MTAAPTSRSAARPTARSWPRVVGAAVVTIGVGAAVWASTWLRVGPAVHNVALFTHLASLVVGFGAVLTVDWVALLWAIGGRGLDEVVRTVENARLPAWVGYCGLVASGALLAPDLTRWTTVTKLALVVVIGWNGIVATALEAPLARIAHRAGRPRPGRGLLVACGVTAVVSQVAWWGATTIGFLNRH